MEQGSGRRTIFNLYVGGVIAVGALILLVAVSTIDLRGFAGAHPASFLLYTACLFLCELKPVQWLRRQDGEFTASWTFACALMLSAPLPSVLLLLATASLLGDHANRKAPVQTAFNVAQLTVSMAVGAGMLSVLGGGQALVDSTRSLWPYLPLAAVAAIVIYVSNSALTMTVVALHQDVSVRSMVRRGLTINLSTDGMLLALAPILVVVAERSILLTPLLLLVAWAVYDSATRALARQHEAMHDLLTQLPNRRMFFAEVQLAIEEAARRKRQVAIMLVDLDGFKEINDRLGHHVGDAVLQAASSRFRAAVRAQDLVARLGGDEFAVLLTHIDGPDSALARAAQLLQSLEEPCTVAEATVRIGGSFGIALYPDHGLEAEELLQRADKAMYHAKSRRLGISMFNEARDRDGHGRLSLLTELEEAIDSGNLGVDYLPRVRMSGNAVAAVESVIRWEHPTRGLVPAAAFLPLVERSELMPRLTRLLLHKALRQCAAWRSAGLEIEVSISAAARDLLDPSFPSTVADELRSASIPAHQLEIAFAESTLMADPYHTSEILVRLREVGVRVAISDFGAGPSSLAALRDLPIDRVKLDRSFVAGAAGADREALIVRSVVDLAHGLGLETIAAGVESPQVLERLAQLRCDLAQGDLVALAANGAVLTPWLAKRRPAQASQSIAALEAQQ